MNVSNKLTYQRPVDGNFKAVSISLGWYDLVRLVEEKRVEGYHVGIHEDGDELLILDDADAVMPVEMMQRVLAGECDMLLWRWVYRDGGCQRETADEEIAKAMKLASILR